jgi:hypothetical protein
MTRPCPFCGCDAQPTVESDQCCDRTITGVDPDNGPVYWAECGRCGARGPLVSWAADAQEAWDSTDFQPDEEDET